jgi:hypothetical protein
MGRECSKQYGGVVRGMSIGRREVRVASRSCCASGSEESLSRGAGAEPMTFLQWRGVSGCVRVSPPITTMHITSAITLEE